MVGRASTFVSTIGFLCVGSTAYAAADATGGEVAPPDTSPGPQSTAVAAGRNFDNLGEIVVTAQRRSQNLQDVPVAVAVVTQEQLNMSGVTGLGNIQVAIPSLSVQNIAGYLGLHLRGVGSIANGPGFENPIALYVDGVYYANQSFGLASFNNIERIEVLKGPQGTLFGRNATGGLVDIVTKDPGNKFEANGSVDYGNYHSVETKLYVGGPLADGLSADVAARFARHDGWGTNLYNGSSAYAVSHDDALRSKVVWTPGGLKFTLIGDYTNRVDSTDALRSVPGSLITPTVAAPAAYSGWNVDSNTQPLVSIKGGGLSLKGEGDIGFATLSNIVAWRQSVFRSAFDYDGSPLPFTGVVINQKDSQVSDEVQLASNSSANFSWVAGAFFFGARARLDPLTISLGPTPEFNPAFPLGSVITDGLQDTRSASGYAQGTYKITDRLAITGGIRYSWDKRELDADSNIELLVPGNPILPAVPRTQKTVTYDQPTYRGSIDYDINDALLLYASVNTGFKSGGFNVTLPQDPAYRPEKLTAYEIGEKADFLDRKVRVNTAVFYYDYKDIQAQIAESTGTGITNGAGARIYGADLDVTAVPISGLKIIAASTLLHATFSSFPSAPIGVIGGGYPVTTGSVTGDKLGYSPDFTGNLSASYQLPIGANTLGLAGGVLYSSSFFFEPDNRVRQAAYHQFNASITYNFDSDRYFVSAYGSNLNNAVTRSLALSTPSGPQIEVLQPPRTYGVRAGFQF